MINQNIKYPKKVCENCGHVVQMHFDISKEWNKVRYARCPKCHKALFETSESLTFYKINDYEKSKLKKVIIIRENKKKLSTAF